MVDCERCGGIMVHVSTLPDDKGSDWWTLACESCSAVEWHEAPEGWA